MNIESLKEQARGHEQNEEWREALLLYKRAIDGQGAEDQVDIGLYNRVGDLQIRMGEIEQAVEHYERAADLYLEADLPNNAVAVYKKVLRNVPARSSTYLKIGQVRASQGFLTDARHNFLTYAERMQLAGDLEEAFRALIEFADLAPDDVTTRLLVASQLESHDRVPEAVQQLLHAYRRTRLVGADEEAEGLRARILRLDPEAEIPEVHHDPSSVLGFESTSLAPDAHEAGLAGEVGPDPHESTVDGARDVAPQGGAAVPDVEAWAAAAGKNRRESRPTEAGHPGRASDFDVRDGELEGVEGSRGRVPFDDDIMGAGGRKRELDAGGIPQDGPTGTGATEPGLEDKTALFQAEYDAPDHDTAASSAEPLRDDDALSVADEDQDAGFLPLIQPDDPPGKPWRASAPGIELEGGDLDPSGSHVGDPDESFPDEGPGEPPGTEDLAGLGEAFARRDGFDLDDPLDAEASSEERSPSVPFGDEPAEDASIDARPPRSSREDPEDLLRRGRELIGRREGADGVALLNRAHAAFAHDHDLDRAMSVVRELIRHDPDDVAHRQRMVEYAHHSGQPRLIVPAYLDLAACLERAGGHGNAEAVYHQVLAVDPENRTARAALGLLGEGDTTEREMPTDEDGFVDLGSMILDTGPATTRFIVPAESPSGDEKADFMAMLRQFKDKVADNLSADDHRGHYDLGTAYKEMGLMDEAISEFQKAIRANGGALAAYEMLGQCFLDRGQNEIAIRSLERALGLPTSVEDDLLGIYYYVGKAHEAAGNTDSAREFYEKVFSLDINFLDVTERLRDLR